MEFKLDSHFKPSGDQPQAIEGLCDALRQGVDNVTLLGVTGSGKTFTMANVLERCQPQPKLELEARLRPGVAYEPLLVHRPEHLPGAAVFFPGLAESCTRPEPRVG